MHRILAVIAAALVLTGCGGQPPKAAGDSASRLLAAAIAGDRVAFEAEIDRRAVREDLRRQVVELARVEALDVDGGPSDFVLDRMISPAAVKVVDAGSGARLAEAPAPEDVRKLLKVVDKQHVCLSAAEADDRCLLTFAKTKAHWRLVGMQAMDLRIEFESGD